MIDKDKTKKLKIRCIVCPSGCNLEITLDKKENKIKLVEGNECKRGIKFATEEVYNPLRLLTTTIKINSKNYSRLPVRSIKPVPKKMLERLVNEVKKIEISAPVKMGQIIADNLLNQDIKIISSCSVDE